MFRILFENDKNSKWVYFNVYDTEIAKKWYEELINYNEIDEIRFDFGEYSPQNPVFDQK